MKKILMICFVLLSSLSFAQNHTIEGSYSNIQCSKFWTSKNSVMADLAIVFEKSQNIIVTKKDSYYL